MCAYGHLERIHGPAEAAPCDVRDPQPSRTVAEASVAGRRDPPLLAGDRKQARRADRARAPARIARSTWSAPEIRIQCVSLVDFATRPTRREATMPTLASRRMTPSASSSLDRAELDDHARVRRSRATRSRRPRTVRTAGPSGQSLRAVPDKVREDAAVARHDRDPRHLVHQARKQSWS